MARSRNIKPGFFLNELLGSADPYVQLLFAGLWCLADKEGRIEDRPLRIKAEIFPYRENLDIHGYLTELSRLKFILRYSVKGNDYIEILNFKKHQSPHHTEKNSVIPPSCEITVNTPLEDGGNPPDSLIPDSLIPDSLIPEENKKEPLDEIGKGNIIPASCKHRACLVIAGLIPDSLNLIPDSLKKIKTPRKKKEVPDLEAKIVYAENVTMTPEEHAKLVAEHGEAFTAACIAKISNYKGANGKTYKSDYLAILSWVVDEVKKKFTSFATPDPPGPLSSEDAERIKRTRAKYE